MASADTLPDCYYDLTRGRTLAHGPAPRLSDQDIMPRYRMTPPGRGRPPAATKRGALQLTPERAEANGRGARLG
ncbi:MAG: hypothetical protein LC776_00065 [Acidobacteria bacterium]|nr:hypothetical protein [Acidobacteriota bacterium]